MRSERSTCPLKKNGAMAARAGAVEAVHPRTLPLLETNIQPQRAPAILAKSFSTPGHISGAKALS